MDARKEAERQLALLERGCEEIVPREELLAKLERSVREGKPLRVKLGIDPTTRNVHLGHMVPYGKLRQFQDLGHEAVLIIGDYTASIGDPSGRNAERPPLSLEEVKRNAETYTDQIFRVVDREHAEIRWQSDWFSGISLADTLSLAGTFSLAHMLAHETFRLRYERGARVGIHELMYPMLQAFDSVAIGADVELGGTDQKFNILSGRDLQRERGLEPQCAMLMPLLPGLDGQKMSKSLGNDIPVSCGSDEQFARIMSVADSEIATWRRLVLLDPEPAGGGAGKGTGTGNDPMGEKLELATRVVDRFNGPGSGEKARAEWERRFSRRENPSEMPSFVLGTATELPRLLLEAGLTASTSEARRLIREGAVYLGDGKAADGDPAIDPRSVPPSGLVVRIGRRRFLRVLRKE